MSTSFVILSFDAGKPSKEGPTGRWELPPHPGMAGIVSQRPIARAQHPSRAKHREFATGTIIIQEYVTVDGQHSSGAV